MTLLYYQDKERGERRRCGPPYTTIFLVKGKGFFSVDEQKVMGGRQFFFLLLLQVRGAYKGSSFVHYRALPTGC